MSSTVDTITASGSAVFLSPPSPYGSANGYNLVGYAVVAGTDDLVVLASNSSASSPYGTGELIATGYTPTGAQLFQTQLANVDSGSGVPESLTGPVIAALPGGNVAVAWQIGFAGHGGQAEDGYAVLTPTGAVVNDALVGQTPPQGDQTGFNYQSAPVLYATVGGFDAEWNAHSPQLAIRPGYPQVFGYEVQSFDSTGNELARTTTDTLGNASAHGFAALAAGDLELTDNQVQFFQGGAAYVPVTIPGEPAHAITSEAAAGLADGQAAVAWVDSGTDYVALFNPSTNSFGASIGLDWGGASDVKVVGLPDGDFAVSWINGGQYKGEVFSADGTGGGIIPLAGDVAGIDSQGDLYTVGLNAGGQYVVQTYAIGGSGVAAAAGPGTGSSVSTSDGDYTAPAGVTTITLTGSGQTIHANNAGDTINSGDSVNTLIGGTGADTFHLGRGGDIATGGGGADVFALAQMPWNGGHITDFQAGDTLDLTGLMATTADTGSNGFADGYLKITADSQGDAQVWAQYATTGSSSGWWLVETLDGVSASSLQTNGDIVTLNSGSGSGSGSVSGPGSSSSDTVSTSASSYTAPSNVTTITLTGSQQTIDASATNGVIITSNNTGNTLIAGGGTDLFHLGRGGDVVTGGSGADTFAYAETPWAAGTINNFVAAQGDQVDVTGLLAKSGYQSGDPFAEGYLKYAVNAHGDAQLLSDIAPGDGNWWTVVSIVGVSPANLHYSNGVIS